MTHTYSKSIFHLVWSTKNRYPFIDQNLKPQLYRYLHTIIENKNCKSYIINGMPDHIHILASLPLNITVSSFVQQVKVSSTRWIRGHFSNHQHQLNPHLNSKLNSFSWQEGLGAFSVGYSHLTSVIKYIENQEKHHEKLTFEQEYRNLLVKLGINYDERFIFG